MSQKVITFHYTLSTKEGQTIDSTQGQNPLIFLTECNQVLPALEDILKTMSAGEKNQIALTHEQAYGPHRSELVFQADIKELPRPDVKEGDVFEVKQGHQVMPVMVTKVDGDQITLDGNPPKHSDTLVFSVEVTEIRDATEEEIAHGHAHGGGCCGGHGKDHEHGEECCNGKHSHDHHHGGGCGCH